MGIFFEGEKQVLIQIEQKSDWLFLLKECCGYLDMRSLQKISSYLNNSAKTLIIEKGYFDKDYRDTFYNFFSKKFAFYPSRTVRVHFFNKLIPDSKLFNLEEYQDNYIGFIIVRPNRVNPIGRTLLNPKFIDSLRGYMCVCKNKVHILGSELIAEGFPFISQDTDVTVCAHSACWMVFRYFSEKFSKYSEICPYEITQLTQNLSYGRLVPSRGLTVLQVTEMFSGFGFYPIVYERGSVKARGSVEDRFDLLLYTYIESGLPIVACMTKQRHAIAIFGHNSDFSKSSPAVPGSSYQYLNAFIINDDNFMPYQSVEKDKGSGCTNLSKFKISDIDYFIVPLYEKIYLAAEYVMFMTEVILKDDDCGIKSVNGQLSNADLITRTFLTSSKSFKNQAKKRNLPFGISELYCDIDMPKFIWVTELSTPAFFSKGKVIGEIIYDATANSYDSYSFLAIHYPNSLILNNRDEFSLVDVKQFKQFSYNTTELWPYDCYINNLSGGCA